MHIFYIGWTPAAWQHATKMLKGLMLGFPTSNLTAGQAAVRRRRLTLTACSSSNSRAQQANSWGALQRWATRCVPFSIRAKKAEPVWASTSLGSGTSSVSHRLHPSSEGVRPAQPRGMFMAAVDVWASSRAMGLGPHVPELGGSTLNIKNTDEEQCSTMQAAAWQQR